MQVDKNMPGIDQNAFRIFDCSNADCLRGTAAAGCGGMDCFSNHKALGRLKAHVTELATATSDLSGMFGAEVAQCCQLPGTVGHLFTELTPPHIGGRVLD